MENNPERGSSSRQPCGPIGPASLLIERCFLCEQRPVHWIGVFVPDYPELWPGPPVVSDKQRMFAYGICRRCWGLWLHKQMAQRVEQKILRTLPTEATQH
jgi:hypothetical protein